MNMYIIGLSGKMGSGKNTADRYIRDFIPKESYEVKTFAFGDEVKQYALKYFPTLVGTEDVEAKTDIARAILQGIGHGFRKEFGDDFWVEKEFAKLRTSYEEHLSSGSKKQFVAIFTDIRYINELVRVILLDRHYEKSYYGLKATSAVLRLQGRTREYNTHKSEVALDNFDFKTAKEVTVYENTETLEDLSNFTKEWTRRLLK